MTALPELSDLTSKPDPEQKEVAPPVKSGPWGLLLWATCVDASSTAKLAISSLAVAICEISLPLLLAALVDEATTGGSLTDINLIGLAMLSAVGLLYIFHVLLLQSEASLVNGGTFRLRSLLYRRVLEQPIGWFASQKAGELSHRITADGEVIENHGVYVVSEIPFAIITIVGVSIAMLWLSWPLALGVIVFLALTGGLAIRLGRPIPTIRQSIQQISARLSHRLQESVNGIRSLRTSGAEKSNIAILDALNSQEMELETQEGRIAAKLEPILELIEMLGVIIVVWCGALLLREGNLSAGQLVAFIAYIELLSEPVGRCGKYIRSVQTCRGVLARTSDFLQSLEPSVPQGEKTSNNAAELIASGINFSYPGSDSLSIQDISIELRSGEVVALVGPNGAGKSTLIDILLGLRQPSSGNVLVAGIPVSEWNQERLRQIMIAAPQETAVFHGTLSENISFWSGISREKIEQSAEMSGMSPLISKLKNGLDTIVGDRGARLSGGERQRLGLARLLARSPRIAILDEPTSAMDGKASRDTSQAIQRLARSGCAVLIVAHRDETVELADRVVMIESGKVTGIGKCRELAGSNDGFRKIFPGISALDA